MQDLQTATDGWDEIIEIAGRDNIPSQGQAKAMATMKQVMALEDVVSSVQRNQKILSGRLDDSTSAIKELNNTIQKGAESSDKLGFKTLLLTLALVFATIVQAIAAVLLATQNN